MKQHFAICIFVFFLWNSNLLSVKSNIETYLQDSDPSDPIIALAMEIYNIEQLKCRQGFNNISDDLNDAVYHCANIRHVQEGRRKFSDEKVKFDGPTPLLCLRVCVMAEAGVLTTQRDGINETALMDQMKKTFKKAGGLESAFKITKEFMECIKKHPTIFPKMYDNCTDAEDLLRCTGRALARCESNKEKVNQLYKESLHEPKASAAL